MPPTRQGSSSGGKREIQLNKGDTPEDRQLRIAARFAMDLLKETAATKMAAGPRANNYLTTPFDEFPKFKAKLTARARSSATEIPLTGINLFCTNFETKPGHWDKLVRLCEHGQSIGTHPMNFVTNDILNFIHKYHPGVSKHNQVVSLIRQTYKYVGRGVREDGDGGGDALAFNPVAGDVLDRIRKHIDANPHLQARKKHKEQEDKRKHHSGIISPSATYHLMMDTLHTGYLQQYMCHKANGGKLMRTALAMLFGLYEGSRTKEIMSIQHEDLWFRCPLLEENDYIWRDLFAKSKPEGCRRASLYNYRTPWLTLVFLDQECLDYIMPRIRYCSIAMPKTPLKGGHTQGNEKVPPNVTTRTSIYEAYNALGLLFMHVLVMRMTLKALSGAPENPRLKMQSVWCWMTAHRCKRLY